MNVSLVAPLVAPLGPSQVGGAQSIVVDLARGLALAGDIVELLAPPGSRVSRRHGHLRLVTVPAGPFPDELLRLGGTGPRRPVRALATAATSMSSPPLSSRQLPAWVGVAASLRAGRGPVHVHAMDWAAFACTAALTRPVVHTLHLGPVDPAAVVAAQAGQRAGAMLVAPSDVVATAWSPYLAVDVVIPNGVDPATIPFSGAPDAQLAVVAGRISPEKGTDVAIRAARAAGFRVLVAGPAYDGGYFEEAVAPLLDGDNVRHLGAVARSRLARVLGRAAVAVLASRWAEPFGLVAVEAALAGTPVAVTPRGALPAVVGDDLGVVAAGAGVGQLAAATRRAAAMDRAGVRAAAERRHSLALMVQRHRALYRALDAR